MSFEMFFRTVYMNVFYNLPTVYTLYLQ